MSPVPPPVEAPPADHRREPFQQLAKVFMDEVQQQLTLPTIRRYLFNIRFECPSIFNINFLCSYLRLYTTMPVAKMAAFLEMPDTDFRTHLLCFKHKMKNVVWTKGTSGLDGELQSGSEVKYLRIVVLVECILFTLLLALGGLLYRWRNDPYC